MQRVFASAPYDISHAAESMLARQTTSRNELGRQEVLAALFVSTILLAVAQLFPRNCLILVGPGAIALDRAGEGSDLGFNRSGSIAQLAVMAILMAIIGLTLLWALR